MGWSKRAETLLREAGWFPGREVDITRWEDLVTDEGFPLHAEARRFLREFGGLVVEVDDDSEGVDRAPASFDLDPDLCSGQREWFERLGRRAGATLFPVGDVEGGHAHLGVDERGGVHMLFLDEVHFLGKRGEALGNLIDGVR
ncbi:SUKH-3 domain-containing protein [Saccharothrix sp. NPDC042600]|uniref:SUKH-3 domain-containing protein n=1 Tax=Saccharothrix TaxID=2071 RepID=UPI0033D494FB|nr:hypothetical protein GCM10017745_45260 [Saccharothrix mutabilis subsp. capreolus]